MNDDFLEKLSVLMDGELSDFETRQLLRQLDQMPDEQKDQVYKSWQRMQLSSAVLKSSMNGLSISASEDSHLFVQGVADAIGNEEPHAVDDEAIDMAANAQNVTQKQALHTIQSQSSAAFSEEPDDVTSGVDSTLVRQKAAEPPLWSRMALAASVALAVVVGVQQYQMGVQQERLLSASAQQSSQIDGKQLALLADLQAAQSEEEQLVAQQRLMDYLKTRRPVNGAGAADPFARVANFADEAE